MEKNLTISNTNFLRKVMLLKEPNSWNNLKKLEKIPNIMIISNKNNKQLQITLINKDKTSDNKILTLDSLKISEVE